MQRLPEIEIDRSAVSAQHRNANTGDGHPDGIVAPYLVRLGDDLAFLEVGAIGPDGGVVAEDVEKVLSPQDISRVRPALDVIVRLLLQCTHPRGAGPGGGLISADDHPFDADGSV